MRINARNLNKKEDDGHFPPRRSLINSQPDYQYPIIVKRSNTRIIVLGIVIGAVLLLPVVFIVIGGVAAVAIPSLLESRKAANQARAVSNLRKFYSAQITYYSTSGTSAYGSFDDLIKANLITDERISDVEYQYTLSRSRSGDMFCILADSPKSGKVFAVDLSGVIYHSDRGGMTCDNGTIAGNGGKPLQNR